MSSTSTFKSVSYTHLLILRDVSYVIEAHFEMTDQANETDNPGKFKDIMMRRLKRGECYHTVSYTHLDVYKRQLLQRSVPERAGLTP